MNLEQVAHFLRQHKSFLITTHTHPDGDGLGSELALFSILEKMGKQVWVVNSDPTPPRYLPYLQGVRWEDPPEVVDCLVVLDTSEFPRMGRLQYRISNRFRKVIHVDHHVSSEALEDSHWVDIQAAATAEMVYRLSLHLGIWDRQIATGIYLGITTDTNWFRNSRTSMACHHIAEQCLKAGVNPAQIYSDLFMGQTLESMQFLGSLFQHIQYLPTRQVAYVKVPKSLRVKFGASVEDVYHLAEHLMTIAHVDIALVFREEDDGKIRVSLRSRGDKVVNTIAEKIGGGGHREAAGALLHSGMDEAVSSVLALV